MVTHMVTHMDPHMNAHMGDFIKLQTKERILLPALSLLVFVGVSVFDDFNSTDRATIGAHRKFNEWIVIIRVQPITSYSLAQIAYCP